MNEHLLPILARFDSLKTIVIGEAMLDSYLDGTTGRLCREAPVPVVNLQRRRDLPGGAANTAVNVAALGGQVSFVSVVGDDAEAALVREALEHRHVSAAHLVTETGRGTLTKNRVSSDGQIIVRFDQGSTGATTSATDAGLVRELESLWPETDAVLISDYDYGVLSPGVIRCIAALQSASPRILVADSKRLGVYRTLGCTAVKPNYSEACELAGISEAMTDRKERLERLSGKFLGLTGARMVALTLDAEGALLFQHGAAPYDVATRRPQHASVAGAGDTFSAALTLSLAAGATGPQAADIAAAAAGVAVAREATAVCSASELRQAVLGDRKVVSDLAALREWVDEVRRAGRRIVFTNGCFDIIHSGHVAYLDAARAEGDLLIVGLNSDASVARLKGTGRPINPLTDRARVLAGLGCVDFVVPFEEDTPAEIIRAVRPEVFVKGGDYTEATLPEAPLVRELGGVVRLLPFVEDHSTTLVIARIRETMGAPAG